MNEIATIAEAGEASVTPVTLPSAMAQLFKALADAQAEFPDIPKRRVATVRTEKGSYTYHYADLADVFDAVRPVLSAYGLSISQWTDGDNLMSMLAHQSGAYIVRPYPIHQRPDGKMHPAQNYSAGVTFAKRYGITALLGVATEESIEGDDSRRRADDAPAKGNGKIGMGEALRDGWSDAVLNHLSDDATPRQKAEAYADALEKEWAKFKTKAGLNGAWNKRQKIIDALAERHDDLYQVVFDAFHAQMDSLDT